MTVATTGSLLVADVSPAAAAMTAPARAITERIDEARQARGIPRLDTRPGLVAVAREWAEHLAATERRTVHAAVMDSPPHRANVLDRDFTQVGVGAVERDGRLWVVEVFRRPAR